LWHVEQFVSLKWAEWLIFAVKLFIEGKRLRSAVPEAV
jgi:hypothetical protein